MLRRCKSLYPDILTLARRALADARGCATAPYPWHHAIGRAGSGTVSLLLFAMVSLLPLVLLVSVTLVSMPHQEGAQDCLTEAIYFEARGEPWNGQLAVANVILNRVKHPKFPNDVCDVVRQRYQFSYNWDGTEKTVREPEAWAAAEHIARMALEGFVLDGVEEATFYHAAHVSPQWSQSFNKLGTVGQHVFYRADQP